MNPSSPDTQLLEPVSGATGAGEGPFDARFDETGYYPEPGRERYRNLLLHLAPYSDLLLILGERGSGKTVLLKKLLSGAAETWRVAHVSGDGGIDNDRLLDVLQRDLSLRASPESSLEERLEDLRRGLHAQRRAGLVPLVLIDDAHTLNVTVLSMLEKLTEPWEKGERLLGALLFGESALEQTFAAAELSALRSRIGHTFELRPMTEADTAAYINHRLSAAGLVGEVFTPSVIRSIHSASGGLPGRVNELAREILQKNERPRVQPLPVDKPSSSRWPSPRLLAIATALPAMLVLTGVYWDDLQTLFRRGDEALAHRETASNLPAAPLARSESEPPPFRPVPSSDRLAAGVPAVSTPEAIPPAAETAAPPPASIVRPPADPVVAPVENTATSSKGSEDRDRSAVRSSAKNDSDQSVRASVPPAAFVRDEDLPARTPSSSEWPSDLPPPRTPSSSEWPSDLPPPRTPSSSEYRDLAWLLSQGDGRYTVQLIVKESEEGAKAFVESLGLKGDIAIYRARGQKGFTVAYGIYSSYDEARAAAAELAPTLQGVSPWVRSVNMIRRQVNAREAAAHTEIPTPAGN
jgi:DamX protein